MAEARDKASFCWFLGIGISKGTFEGCCIDRDGKALFQVSLPMNQTHNKLIATASLDPSVYQSGQYEGHGRITKRGNRHLRRVIWLMTVRAIQFNCLFKSYYQKQIDDGLPFKKAVLATVHKFVRIIFVLLTRRTMFCAQVTS